MDKETLESQIMRVLDQIYQCIINNYKYYFSNDEPDFLNRLFYDYLVDDIDEEFDQIINENIEDDVLKRSNYKDLCIINIVSLFYELTNRKINIGVCTDEERNVFDIINEKNYSYLEIIEMFKNEPYENFGYDIIDCVHNYTELSMINRKFCLLNLIEQHKMPKMIKMNPMIISSYPDILRNKYPILSYIAQEIIDIVDNICWEYNCDGINEDTLNLLKEKIDDRYGKYSKKIYGLIASVAYEGIVCYSEFEGISLTEKENKYIKFINQEMVNLDLLYNVLDSDDELYCFVLNNFVDKNYYLDEDDMEIRKEFMQKQGYTKILKKYINCDNKEI